MSKEEQAFYYWVGMFVGNIRSKLSNTGKARSL